MTDDELANEPDLPQPKDHPLGIYFGLPEDDHHADEACGSSDMKRLSYDPPSWWWASKWNPSWVPEKLTKALIVGRARHTLAFYGREKFEKSYGRKTLPFNTTAGKKQQTEFLLNGKTPLDEDDYDRTLLLGTIIRANPYLSEAFEDAVGYEISIFWERGGLKRKARFDCLRELSIVDLKNVSNERNISFPQACLRYLDNYHGHVQAEHYREARVAMRALFEQGLIFGDVPDMARLKAAVMSSAFNFTFLFAQSSNAPLTWATRLSYKAERMRTDDDDEFGVADLEEINPIFQLGRAALNRADRNYKKYFERFGLGVPWLLAEPIKELDVNQLPPWALRGGEEPAA